MKKICYLIAVLSTLMFCGTSHAVIIDFEGGLAYLNDGSSVVTTDTDLYNSVVDYYIEDGVRVDFVGNYGTIGDYYNNSSSGGLGGLGNSVIHAHPFTSIDIVFSMLDGSAFDLTYVDMASNTDTGGGLASGNERSFITTNFGYSLMLAPSDWGVDYTYFGDEGDGIVRNWMDTNFHDIYSFTISSENAYCFGMDNFFINEPPPSTVPEPSTFLLLTAGLASLVLARRKKQA